MQEEVYELKKKLSAVTLDAMYSPNTIPHQHIWAPEGEIVENAFVSDIGEENTKVLMKLNIENIYKVLLLLGIGTFKYHENKEYVYIWNELSILSWIYWKRSIGDNTTKVTSSTWAYR